MPTLMTVGNGEGERRCDAKCYEATNSKCTCICGGMNHGVGLKRAQDNTLQVAEKICVEHGIQIAPQQIGLGV